MKDPNKCQWPYCRQPGDCGSYYGQNVCDEHWDTLWDIPTPAERREKLSVPEEMDNYEQT